MSRVRLAVVVLCLVVSWALSSLAREAPVVVLVLDATPGALHRRLEAELRSLGFRVVTDLGTGELSDRAKERGADAAVRVATSRRAVEVWVTDPERNRTAARSVVLSGSGVTDAVLAVRVVELLRAAFLEIHVEMPTLPAASSAPASSSAAPSASSSAPPVPASPSASASAPAPPPSSASPIVPPPGAPAVPPARPLRAALGVGGSTSPGGPSADVHLVAAVSYRTARWELGALGVSPGALGRVDDGEDRASFRAAALALEGARVLGGPTTEARVGAGAGAVRVVTTGETSASFSASSDGAWLAWVFARVGLAHRLGERVLVDLDLRIGPTLPQAEVRFGSRTVGTWGRPLVVPSVLVEVPF